jgi:hypothetical protein
MTLTEAERESLSKAVCAAVHDCSEAGGWASCDHGFGYRDSADLLPAVEAIIAARLAPVEAERDSAQHHLAYHLSDFRPGADSKATGDLAVDMAHYAERMRAERDAARAALGVSAPTGDPT